MPRLWTKMSFKFQPPTKPELRGARWPSGRASDSGGRAQGFDIYIHRVVSLSKDTFTSRKILVIPRKRWLHPDMTDKLFTGTLSLNKKNKPSYTQVSKATNQYKYNNGNTSSFQVASRTEVISELIVMILV